MFKTKKNLKIKKINNMKEQLNLVEILKDCPEGMELDCTMYDNVTLKSVSLDINNGYPICIETKHGFNTKLTKYGQNVCIDDAKCVIFPKGKTSWEGFQRSFKDGDKIHFWTIQDAKEGDVLAINWYEGCDYWEKIVIFKKYHNEGANSPCVEGYGNTFKNGKLAFQEEVPFFSKTWTSCLEPATKEQRDFLFQKIKESGYKWNPETKTLEKLIVPKFKVGDTIRSKNGLQIYKISNVTSEYYTIRTQGCTGLIPVKDQDDWILIPSKFDPKTLKPFDKVLVRDIGYNTRWHVQFFETMYEDEKKYPFVCLGGKIHSYCIPYTGNEHLLNTINEPSEFYRYW